MRQTLAKILAAIQDKESIIIEPVLRILPVVGRE